MTEFQRHGTDFVSVAFFCQHIITVLIFVLPNSLDYCYTMKMGLAHGRWSRLKIIPRRGAIEKDGGCVFERTGREEENKLFQG